MLKLKKILSRISRLTVACILGTTLYFKFTDHPETVSLFSQIQMGAGGYKLIGALELITCILLLVPGGAAWGGLLAWGLMSGALIAHTTAVGFQGSHGTLAAMAALAWLLSIFIMYVHAHKMPFFKCIFRKSPNELHN